MNVRSRKPAATTENAPASHGENLQRDARGSDQREIRGDGGEDVRDRAAAPWRRVAGENLLQRGVGGRRGGSCHQSIVRLVFASQGAALLARGAELASAGIGRYLRSRRLTNPHDRLPSPMHRARSASRPKPLLGTVGDAARRSRKFAGEVDESATGSVIFVWTSTISGCRPARELEALAARTRFRGVIEARSARRLWRR